MRIAILGGGGLLGSEIYTELVSKGHDVAIVDNFSGSYKLRVPDGRKVYAHDVSDHKALSYMFKSFKPEALFIAVNFYYKYKDTNYNIFDETKLILNTTNSIASLLTKGIKEVYYCSGSEVYGTSSSKAPIKESKRITTSANLRGTAFKASEDMLLIRCRELGIRLVNFRIFDMYGPRIVYTPITGRVNFLIDAFRGYEQVGLTGPKDVRDFIHVRDASAMIASTIETDFNGIMNIGTGTGTSLIQLCGMLNKNMKLTYPPVGIPTGPPKSCIADVSLCKEITGISPSIKLEDELKGLIEFRLSETEFYSSRNSAQIIKSQRGL